MGLMSGLFGATVGVGVQMYANAIRKLPIAREPYIHFAFGCVGGWVGVKYSSWEKKMLEDVNEMRADRKMPQLDRAGGWQFGTKLE